MIPAEMPPLAAATHRAIHDILAWTVIVVRVVVADFATIVAQVDQVEISGGDVEGGTPQITGDGERLEEHFRSNHSRAKIEEASAIQL